MASQLLSRVAEGLISGVWDTANDKFLPKLLMLSATEHLEARAHAVLLVLFVLSVPVLLVCVLYMYFVENVKTFYIHCNLIQYLYYVTVFCTKYISSLDLLCFIRY